MKLAALRAGLDAVIMRAEWISTSNAATSLEAGADAPAAEQFLTDGPCDDEQQEACDSEELVRGKAECSGDEVLVARDAQEQPRPGFVEGDDVAAVKAALGVVLDVIQAFVLMGRSSQLEYPNAGAISKVDFKSKTARDVGKIGGGKGKGRIEIEGCLAVKDVDIVGRHRLRADQQRRIELTRDEPVLARDVVSCCDIKKEVA